MAKLSPEILTNIFNLLRQLAEEIENACSTEWILFEKYGENPRTNNELEELQNVKERLNQSYSRLNILTLRILEAQPIASNAMVNLLSQAIHNGSANLEASHASIQEIKKGWSKPMSEQNPYPDEETKKRCLERLRQTNYQLELYNLFLDDAIAQIDAELRQQKRARLLQRNQLTKQL